MLEMFSVVSLNIGRRKNEAVQLLKQVSRDSIILLQDSRNDIVDVVPATHRLVSQESCPLNYQHSILLPLTDNIELLKIFNVIKVPTSTKTYFCLLILNVASLIHSADIYLLKICTLDKRLRCKT